MSGRRETRSDSEQRIAQLHAEGLTDREAGDRLGVSYQYAKRLRIRLDLAPNRKADRAREEIERLNAQGLSDGEIASRLKLSVSHVKSLRLEGGLAARGALVTANIERGQRTRAEIARMHSAGRDVGVIAAALDLTESYVRDCVRRNFAALGAPADAKPRAAQTRAERAAQTRADVARLKAEGLSARVIAERLGLSVDYVREVSAKLGQPEPVSPVREEADVHESDGEMPRWWREAKAACAEHLDDLIGVHGPAGYPAHAIRPGSAMAQPRPPWRIAAIPRRWLCADVGAR